MPEYITACFKAGAEGQLKRRYPGLDVQRLMSQVYEQNQKTPLNNPTAYLFAVCRNESQREAPAGAANTATTRTREPDDLFSSVQLETEKQLTEILAEAALVAGTGGTPEGAALLVYSRISRLDPSPRLKEFAKNYADLLSSCRSWEEVQGELDRRREEVPF